MLGKYPVHFEYFYSIFFRQNFAFYEVFLKKSSGMANSADPDQTVPEGAI